jgi:outer membrane protein assembly factor BamD (BamD/ComL family)
VGASSLAAEATLLKAAQRAIARGDHDEALQLVSQHSREFSRGMMVEERLVLEVVALCGAGRETRGRVKASRFLEKHPKSPSRKRVMEACEDRRQPESSP